MIPTILHFVWVGPAMPQPMARNIDRWREVHPDWEVRVWGDEDLRWLRNQELFDTAGTFVPDHAVGQFRADVARYEILLRYGGFYADCDTWPVRHIGNSLRGHTAFAVREDKTWIGNTYIGAAPGLEVLHTLVRELPGQAERNRGERASEISGPRFFSPYWRQFGGHIASRRWGFPYSYTHVKSGRVPENVHPETHVIHQWYHSQQLMEVAAPPPGPADGEPSSAGGS